MKKLLLISLMVLSLGATGLFVHAPQVFADSTSTAQSEVCAGANQGNTDSSGGGCTSGSLDPIIKSVINIMSIIVGIIAVIVLIYGGFRYVTSAGDTAKVTAARTTIVYALVGVVIVALAQIIVQFVLNRVVTNGT